MKMKQEFQYGSTIIQYMLEYKDRKTLGIKVHPDKSVQVLAPEGISIEKIRNKVEKKASWIIKQQDFFLTFYPKTPPRKYISGETHLYLGRQYRLKLVESNQPTVKLNGGYIYVYTKDVLNKNKIKRQLKVWYTQKADIHFNMLFNELKTLSKSFYDGIPTLKYRWMSKRWGSCDKQGTIHLNLELIKTSKSCIEYVIIHELCHLKYLNHSNAFYELLDRIYPNWKETKNKLEHLMV